MLSLISGKFGILDSRRQGAIGKVGLLVLLFSIGGCVAPFIQSLRPDPVRTASSQPPTGDDAAYFIRKYGPPGLDESTEYEIPGRRSSLGGSRTRRNGSA